MRISSRNRLTLPACISLIAMSVLLGACENTTSVPISLDSRASRAETCRAGDRIVSSESACLVGDASCYALANGEWCTGPLEQRCPAGSSALTVGQSCPNGARCFRFSDSLECYVNS